MVPLDLVERLVYAFGLGGGLGFHHDHRNAVDKQDHIGANGGATADEAEFAGGVKGIRLGMVGIQEAHIVLAPLGLHEHGLESLEVLPGLQVAFMLGRTRTRRAITSSARATEPTTPGFSRCNCSISTVRSMGLSSPPRSLSASSGGR